MPKYGKGLNIEFANAVKAGIIREPFNTNDVRGFANTRGWNPPDNYINVLLPNGSAETMDIKLTMHPLMFLYLF